MRHIVALDAPDFPYLISQENTPAHNLILVEPRRQRHLINGAEAMFFLLNANINTSYNDDNSAEVIVFHSFARDDEGDRASLARLSFEDFLFRSSSYGEFHFTGWLTDIRFYPNENPFAGSVDLEDEIPDGVERNNGYPYMPPKVVNAAKFPMQTNVTLYDASYDIEELLNSYGFNKDGSHVS